MGIELDATINQEKADHYLKCIHQTITFHGHIIKNLDFSGANLKKSFFKESKISGCNFKGIQAPVWKKIISLAKKLITSAGTIVSLDSQTASLFVCDYATITQKAQ